MKLGSLTATRLRLLLSASLFLIVAIGVGIFSLAESQLKKFAVEVNHATIDSQASENNIQALQKIEQELTSQQETVLKANKIAANSQSYQYQNQIISDLNRYAKRAGITLTNIDFASETTASSGSPSGSAPATPAPAGLKPATISVAIKSPTNYKNLLRFLHSLEQNLTKMQVSSISLSKSEEGISSEVLNIQVYVR